MAFHSPGPSTDSPRPPEATPCPLDAPTPHCRHCRFCHHELVGNECSSCGAKVEPQTTMVQLKVNRIVVVLRRGQTDLVTVEFEGSRNFPVYDKCALQADTLQGTGVAWVRENFGLEPEVIDAR